VPEKLAKSGRAPCYKQIAIAILRNDFVMKSIGFDGVPSEYYRQFKSEELRAKSQQRQLI